MSSPGFNQCKICIEGEAGPSRCSTCGVSLCGKQCFDDHLAIGCGFFLPDLEERTATNMAYRRVLHTTPQQQFVLMHLTPGQDIGIERHVGVTQSFRVEKGHGWASVSRGMYELADGAWLTIPPGEEHNVSADERGPGLWVYTIYSPPVHRDGLVQEVKPAEGADEEAPTYFPA